MGNCAAMFKEPVTQEGTYLRGGHLQFKTGSLQKEAVAAGCLGRLYEGINVLQTTPEKCFNDDKLEMYPNLKNFVTEEEFEELRQACKECWKMTKRQTEDITKVAAEWTEKMQGKDKKIIAHVCCYNDNACYGIVFYEQGTFEALPKNSAEAKKRRMAEAEKHPI